MGAVQQHGQIGILVGLTAEARIARPIGLSLVGNGDPIGMEQAATALVRGNVRALLSFGLAGGLDPGLRPGALVIPREVHTDGGRFPADPHMLNVLGGPTVDMHLADTRIAGSVATKRQLWQRTGAAALDLESGAVARVARRHGLPFAVLRAVCDPAERPLPPAALLAIDEAGAIRLLKVLGSVVAESRQIPALLQLARDAAMARRALIRRVAELRERFSRV